MCLVRLEHAICKCYIKFDSNCIESVFGAYNVTGVESLVCTWMGNLHPRHFKVTRLQITNTGGYRSNGQLTLRVLYLMHAKRGGLCWILFSPTIHYSSLMFLVVVACIRGCDRVKWQ